MSYQRQTVSPREATRPLFVGVDIGATNIKIGLVDDLGRTIGFQSFATENDAGPETAAQQIGQAIKTLMSGAGVKAGEVVAVGLAPGPLDIPQGLLLSPPNLSGWRDFPLRDRVSHHCELPVRFTGDACAAAFGEFWLGSGQQTHSLVMFTLGTGLGCGMVIDGKLLEGSHSHGAMSGHITIDVSDNARICPCGQPGHLEAYVCAIALVKRATELMEEGRKTSLNARLEQGAALTPLLISEEAAAGDALSLELVLETGRYLAIGVVSMMHIIDPDAVLLGGGINFGGPDSPLGRRFLDTIREEVRRRAFPIPAQRATIDYATLGGDAGYLGAAGLARQEYRTSKSRSTASSPPLSLCPHTIEHRRPSPCLIILIFAISASSLTLTMAKARSPID